jgi:hypothetical protein
MDNSPEMVTPFWFSRGRDKVSHVYNRRQWVPIPGGVRLVYLSLDGKVGEFRPELRLNSWKHHCKRCDRLVQLAVAAGKPWADLPEECLEP